MGRLLYLQVEGRYRWRVGCCTYRSKVDIDGGLAAVLIGGRRIQTEGWLMYLQVEGGYRRWVGCCAYRSKADIDGGSAAVLSSRR